MNQQGLHYALSFRPFMSSVFAATSVSLDWSLLVKISQCMAGKKAQLEKVLWWYSIRSAE